MAVRGGSVKLDVRDEPLLEFAGNARHVDPRHGIWDYGPIDATSTALRTIRAGIVGTPASVQGLRAWLDKCRLPIAAKDSRLGHLFVPFPGFDTSAGFRSTLVWDSRLERHIRDRDIRRVAGLKPHDAVRAAVELYAAEPEVDPAAPWKKIPLEEPADDFRALLKAMAMRYSRPIQIIRRTTWDPAFTPAGQDKPRLQDEATRAWNLHTALYYKAGGVPWRLPRDPASLDN